MDQNRSRAWTLFGAGVLCLTLAVMASRPAKAPMIVMDDDIRDAVAAPVVSPAMLGGARVVRPETGYFASPAGRRAEAERAMIASRRPISKTAAARAARLRRERALAVSAQ